MPHHIENLLVTLNHISGILVTNEKYTKNFFFSNENVNYLLYYTKPNERIRYCQIRPDKCFYYNQNDDCLLCNDETVLYNKQCVTKCPSGTYMSSDRQCKECFIKCNSCSLGNNGNCYDCKSPYVFNQGYCLNNCPENTYPSSSSKGLICKSNYYK